MWNRPHVTFDMAPPPRGRRATFLATKNVLAAREAVKSIRQSLKILEQQPEVGRPIEEMKPEYWKWPISFDSSGYIALHRFNGQSAMIEALRHQREVGYWQSSLDQCLLK
jgi:plasmid stabilization system protein ParE